MGVCDTLSESNPCADIYLGPDSTESCLVATNHDGDRWPVVKSSKNYSA